MKCILFLTAILALAVPAISQSPLKTVARAEKALGGKKAIKSATTWKAVGTVIDPTTARSGRFQMQAASPNFFHVAYELDGLEYESGYNGRSGWVRDSRNGLRTLTGQASIDLQAEAAYRSSLWLDHKQQRAKLSAGAQTSIDGKAVSVVNLTSQKGTSIRIYFDRTTNLPIRDEVVGEGQMRVLHIQITVWSTRFSGHTLLRWLSATAST